MYEEQEEKYMKCNVSIGIENKVKAIKRSAILQKSTVQY